MRPVVLWLAVAFVFAASAGCASEKDLAVVELPLVEGVYSLTFEVVGKVPIYAPTLPLWPPQGGRVTMHFRPSDMALDSNLIPHAALAIDLTNTTSGMSLGSVIVDSEGLGIVQILLRDVGMPGRFAEQVILRNGSESACLFGGAFLGQDPSNGIEVVGPDGGALHFSQVGKETVLGRQTALVGATMPDGDRLELAIDPGIPCPLRAERTNSRGIQVFRTTLVQLPSAVFPRHEGSHPGPDPVISVDVAPVGTFGIPPDGEAGGRFPIAHAFEIARSTDAPFRAWLAGHKDAVLVRADYIIFRQNVRDVEIWQLTFATADQGYHVDVNRQTALQQAGLPVDQVTRSGMENVSGGPFRDALTKRVRVPTISYFYRVQQALLPGVDPVEWQLSLLGPAPIIDMNYERSVTSECDVLQQCTGTRDLVGLIFDPTTGEVLGFSGGFEAWSIAQERMRR